MGTTSTSAHRAAHGSGLLCSCGHPVHGEARACEWQARLGCARPAGWRGIVRRTGDEELSLQLAQREACREHISAARLAAAQQPGSGLPGSASGQREVAAEQGWGEGEG